VLTVLLNQLHAIEHPLVFVLDDYHLIAHPPIHDGLTFAIEHLPPHVHLVLISRSVPALPLHRWTRRDNQHTVDS
jgi:LuxR family maltose regulon positive regulatory protein